MTKDNYTRLRNQLDKLDDINETLGSKYREFCGNKRANLKLSHEMSELKQTRFKIVNNIRSIRGKPELMSEKEIEEEFLK